MFNGDVLNLCLHETKDQKIGNCWLYIALNSTNAEGYLSKQIDSRKFYDTEYPDVVQEIQAWIANIFVTKRLSLIKHCKVKRKVMKAIKELEAKPDDIVRIFYKYRYIYKTPHTQIKVINK